VNNTCPNCGAIYNVAMKDLGRRIKCKKCGSSLEVRESGLEIEDPNAPPPVTGKPVEEADLDEAPKRKKDRRPAGPAFNPMELLAKVGGIPTVLFGFGVFIILFTGFQDAIGKAKIDKRTAAIEEGQARINGDQRRYDELKNKTGADDEKIKQAKENWEKEKKALEEEKLISELANKRSGYLDRYVMMLGFLSIAFGCMGYLIADYGLVLRIVAAVILLFMVMAMFKATVGHSVGAGAGINLG
jgi:predicted Zn finger-like uncharacterized protein